MRPSDIMTKSMAIRIYIKNMYENQQLVKQDLKKIILGVLIIFTNF